MKQKQQLNFYKHVESIQVNNRTVVSSHLCTFLISQDTKVGSSEINICILPISYISRQNLIIYYSYLMTMYLSQTKLSFKTHILFELKQFKFRRYCILSLLISFLYSMSHLHKAAHHRWSVSQHFSVHSVLGVTLSLSDFTLVACFCCQLLKMKIPRSTAFLSQQLQTGPSM